MKIERFDRAKARGAAFVESLIVISTFILFFMGMVYFRSLYKQKIHVEQLSRAAAVSFAMGACHGNALDSVKQDMMPSGQATPNSGQQQGSADLSGITPTKTNPPVGGQNGQGKGNAVGNMMNNQGVIGDPISGVTIQAQASSTSGGPKTGFHGQAQSSSYMSCGEDQHAGDPAGFLDYIKGEFTSAF